MKTYAKGYRAEREILRFLSSHGYSCIRAASSGNHLTPVDVVAIKPGRTLCFGIKSWSKKPRLDKGQLSRLAEWCKNAAGIGFIAWYNANTWKFLPVKDAEKGRYEDENWIELEPFLRIFAV